MSVAYRGNDQAQRGDESNGGRGEVEHTGERDHFDRLLQVLRGGVL